MNVKSTVIHVDRAVDHPKNLYINAGEFSHEDHEQEMKDHVKKNTDPYVCTKYTPEYTSTK